MIKYGGYFYIFFILKQIILAVPGHKYGPNHDEMGRKLDEMNSVLEHVTKNLPDDCILFVMGDHGMTSTGKPIFDFLREHWTGEGSDDE